MPVGTAAGTEAASKLQSTIARATKSFASVAPATRAVAQSGSSDPGPAAVVQISDAGRAAQTGRTYQPGQPQYGNRVYGPGDAHYGHASNAVATESDQFQTTSPGHKSVGDLGPTLRTAAHEAAHVVQQSVRTAVGDLDGDGRADVAVNGPPSGDIQQAMQARHDIALNAIRNMKA